ncbi:hypothetical protein [Gemmata sp.]|uniref:hypothetical protein n=1 Tax=Gemmata sp. TaxID=1914242 RepID=UPI003F6F4AE6
MNPFLWLRRKAAEAVALGVADGMRAVNPDGEEPPTDLDALRQLVAAGADAKAITAGAVEVEPDPEPVAKRKAK